MKAGGSSAAAAIDALADNGSVDDGFDDLDDLDDVELPDISATPKLKDFLPFMAKGKPGAEPVSSSRKDTALAGTVYIYMDVYTWMYIDLSLQH